MHHSRFFTAPWLLAAALALPLSGSAQAQSSGPESPAVFYPDGLMGVQIGASWADSKKSPALRQMACRPRHAARSSFDEVCFFKTSSRLAGADIHDGFIARKGNRLVLIGTGIAIKDVDDPRAEAVMRELQTRVHAKFQQTGDNVLFANLPERRMTARELDGLAKTTPVLLVGVESKGNEIAVLYGYLAPVNEFSELSAD